MPKWNKLAEQNVPRFIYSTHEQPQNAYKQTSKLKTNLTIDIETLLSKLPIIDHVEVQDSNCLIS